MTDLAKQIEQFLAGSPHAVAGASPLRRKYGNMVLRLYMDRGREVYPVNPHHHEVEGLQAHPDLASLPRKPHGVSIITPPDSTRGIVDQAIALGIENLWMQPGAEHWGAIERAKAAGLNVIAGGACILVEWG